VRRYRLIDHTADVGLVAYGQTLKQAFANAAYGMFSIITELKTVKETTSRRLEINEADTEGLLFEWLNQLLYFFDVEMLLFRKFDINELDVNHLVAVCSGEKYDPACHKLKTGVKSATYHLLKVDRERNQLRVIFDI
jgi:SHS2 domain-containing protein